VRAEILREVPEMARGEVEEYLSGKRREFSEEVVGWVRGEMEGAEFARVVWGEMLQIPYGEVRSYWEIAAAIGKPGAARAVGLACGKNKFPVVVPCHRVVASGGKLGGFSLGLAMKKKLLEIEGWKVVGNGAIMRG